MSCDRVKTEHGVVIICSRGRRRPRCAFCDRPSEFQCDGPAPRRKSKTCDKHMCAEHRTQICDRLEAGVVNDLAGVKPVVIRIADTVDYCPDCLAKADENRQLELF